MQGSGGGGETLANKNTGPPPHGSIPVLSMTAFSLSGISTRDDNDDHQRRASSLYKGAIRARTVR
jgi:hypothetical protein